MYDPLLHFDRQTRQCVSRGARLALALLAALLLSGCFTIILSGPTNLSVGQTTSFVLQVGGELGNVDEYVVADVPQGWTLLSARYEVEVDGELVSGTPLITGTSPCDFPPSLDGYQRIRLVSPTRSITNESTVAEVTLDFGIDDQPRGEYEVAFRFGGDGAGSDCGPPAVRTINRKGGILEFFREISSESFRFWSFARPNSVSVSPDGRVLVATTVENDTFSVFARHRGTGTLRLVDTVSLPVAPASDFHLFLPEREAFFGEEGDHLYVVRRSEARIDLFQMDPGAISHVAGYSSESIPSFEGLVDVAITRDQVYVLTSTSRGLVEVFDRDRETGRLFHLESVPAFEADYRDHAAPKAVGLSGDGTGLFVLGGGTNLLSVFSRDAVGGGIEFQETILEVPPYGARDVLGSPDGHRILVTSSADLFTYDWNPAISDLTFSRDIPMGAFGFGFLYASDFAFGSDGRYIYGVGSAGASFVGVYELDPASGELALVQAEYANDPPNEGLGQPDALAISPDGRHLYASSESVGSLTIFTLGFDLLADGFETGTTQRWSATVQ